MNPRTTATSAAALTVPAAVIIGAGMMTQAIVGLRADRDHWRAAAVQPQPTATVTATAAEQTPAPRPSRTTSARAVIEAQPAGRSATNSSISTDRSSGSSAAPRPAPGPSTSPPAAQPSGCESAVSVRVPLLRRCAITIGGSR